MENRKTSMYEVIDGSITNPEHTFMINNLVMIVDKECGTVLKFGDADFSDVREYYKKAIEKTSAIDSEWASNIIMIEFDRYDGQLTIEEICTILNYGMNCHSKSFMELFSMEIEQLKEKIAELKSYGY